MKTNSKKSTTKKHEPYTAEAYAPLAPGMQRTQEVDNSEAQWPEKSGAFTPMETGQPDPDKIPDIKNPQGVQSGRGPLNQEGEGNRQNDELAELQDIEPKL
jgi:hypothetical protein